MSCESGRWSKAADCGARKEPGEQEERWGQEEKWGQEDRDRGWGSGIKVETKELGMSREVRVEDARDLAKVCDPAPELGAMRQGRSLESKRRGGNRKEAAT
jgi:hypothetical protein